MRLIVRAARPVKIEAAGSELAEARRFSEATIR
jgi:hypothetical protein